jgi:hypothetical protein
MTPSGYAMIPRCAGKLLPDALHRRARRSLRDALAHGGKEPFGACRSFRPVDRYRPRCRSPRGVVLDMDSSVSPTHGEQENSVWNGHYDCTCHHPLFVFNQIGDLESVRYVPATFTRRRREGSPRPSRGAVLRQGLPHLFSGRRRLCESRGLRVPRSRTDQIRHTSAEKQRLAGAVWISAQTASSVQMIGGSPCLNAEWVGRQTRGLSLVNDDGSGLPEKLRAVKIRLKAAPFGTGQRRDRRAGWHLVSD